MTFTVLMDRNTKLGLVCVSVFTVFLISVMIWNHYETVQIENCETLILSHSGVNQYTEEELRSEEVFDFSYYWGLQNNYWQCDKHFDKDQVIEEIRFQPSVKESND